MVIDLGIRAKVLFNDKRIPGLRIACGDCKSPRSSAKEAIFPNQNGLLIPLNIHPATYTSPQAIVIRLTDLAFASSNVRAHASRVAPVVKTSSTSIICLFLTSDGLTSL